MAFRLVIAEKPSVAQTIAAALGIKGKQDGYIEGGGYLISWCVGLDHRLQAADLSLNAAQAVQQLLFLLLRAQRMLLAAGTSLGFRHGAASFLCLYTPSGYLHYIP